VKTRLGVTGPVSRVETKGGVKNEAHPIEWGGPGVISNSTHAEMKLIMSHLGRQSHRRPCHGKCKQQSNIQSTVLVVSVYKGRLRNSRPCEDCIKILRYYGVKKVMYSTGSTEAGCEFTTEKLTCDTAGIIVRGNRR
jgi:hypothetical protein